MFLGPERIDDVTTHPVFRGAAATIARWYDLKQDPARRERCCDIAGEACYSAYFIAPRSREDLERRLAAHRELARLTFGMLGRSPDHMASAITGLAMGADQVRADTGQVFVERIHAYHDHVRERDAYVAYAVLPPRAARSSSSSAPASGLGLQVRESSRGVVVTGAKLLATGAVFADEIWIGNLQPLQPTQAEEALTFAIPVDTPGLSLWSRRALAHDDLDLRGHPLAARFDESDAVVMLDDVEVPWERVFVHRDPAASVGMYFETPSHVMANHQSVVRIEAKVRFLVALARRLVACTGAASACEAQLGRMAGLEAALSAMVEGQVAGCERWGTQWVAPNRRFVYGAMQWCTEVLPELVECLRELSGAGVLGLPAVSAFDHPEFRERSARLWSTAHQSAEQRHDLMSLVWDVVGSGFAGRQQQYEKMYAGPPFVLGGHCFRHTPWNEMEAALDETLALWTRDTAAGA